MTLEISPSLLSANFAQLGAELSALKQAGADRIHLDVMDGHYVPNLTFGPPVIAGLRSATHLPFEVHLMISPVARLLDAFIDAGADLILFHPDAEMHVHRTVAHIKSRGVKAGLVLNPGQSVGLITPMLPLIDQVLVMTVNPGFGGQKFLPFVLETVTQLRVIADQKSLSLDIEVDGGVNRDTAPACRHAGANILVSGTALFEGGSTCYADNIQALRGE